MRMLNIAYISVPLSNLFWQGWMKKREKPVGPFKKIMTSTFSESLSLCYVRFAVY